MQMSSLCETKTGDKAEERTGNKKNTVRVMKGQAQLHSF
jgi:hypothetical protein